MCRCAGGCNESMCLTWSQCEWKRNACNVKLPVWNYQTYGSCEKTAMKTIIAYTWLYFSYHQPTHTHTHIHTANTHTHTQILFHSAGIVMLTLIVNATTTKYLLAALGMSDISHATRVTMAQGRPPHSLGKCTWVAFSYFFLLLLVFFFIFCLVSLSLSLSL